MAAGGAANGVGEERAGARGAVVATAGGANALDHHTNIAKLIVAVGRFRIALGQDVLSFLSRATLAASRFRRLIC